MRKLKLFFACLLMAVLSIGQASAVEEVYKTALFGSSYNSQSIGGYTSSWSSTTNGFTVNLQNANNNNNSWNYIKFGRKNNASVGTITTKDAIDKAITKVTLTIDALTTAKINSIKLYTSDDGSTWTEAGSFTKTTGAKDVTLTSPDANLYYKIEADCASGSSNGLITISKVEYWAAVQVDPGTCEAPEFSPAAGTYVGAQNITLSCETEGAAIHYTLNGDTPDENSPVYSAAIPVSAETTIKAIAIKNGLDNSSVASATYKIIQHAGTLEDPYTVADARLAIDANVGVTGVYMSGIVSQIVTAYSEQHGNISFNIATDGEVASPQVQAYRCKSFNGEKFTSADDVKVGATVTVYGNLTKYNSTYEFAADCYLTAYEGPTEPLVDISNTKATAYTVSEALTLAGKSTSDLTKTVYIKGVVYLVNGYDNGKYNIYIREEEKTEADGKFEFYKCTGLDVNDIEDPTSFEEGSVLVGDTVIGRGTMFYYQTSDIWEFSAGNYLVELIRPEVAVTSVELDQNAASIEIGEDVTLHATVNPDNASNKEITWSVQSGDDYVSIAEGVVTGIAAGEAVIRATSVADGTKYAECTVTVNAPAPDDRYKAEQTGFTATSGKLATVTEGTHQGKEYISYEAKQGDAQTAPSIQNTDKIRLYQNGGLLVIGAAKGCKIDQVFLTTGSTYASTTIGYSKTETAIAQTGDEVAASTEWHTATGQNADTIVIVCLGTNKNSRIDVAKLDVRYTGDPAAIHHYVLAGNYATEFNQADVFNHDGLIVYAAYDEQGEDLVDITADCSFSAPDMNQAGEQTIEITYNNAIVQSYTITINATPTAKLKFYAPVAWENVYAFTWEGTNPGGHEMTAVEEGSRWFECELEKGVPFLVYNGSWDGMNQTENIAALDGPKCYAWATLSGNGKYNTIETCEMSYYIAGENLPEVTWNEGEHKAMTNNEVVFENLAAGTYKFKVTNNTWAWNLGYAYADQTNSNITLFDDNGNVQFTTNVAMNVTIAYNPATEKITVNGIVPPKPFDPNISFNKNAQKINSANVTTSADKDSYGNIWNITTEGTTSFTTNAAYEQVGSSNNPASSITFTTTLTTSDKIAAVSYIAIKLGGFSNTAGDVVIYVDGNIYGNGTLNEGTDVVVETTGTDPMMGREITIEITNIARGVKCYGIEYAYQVYEFVALKFFAPRDETNKWDHVYAYAYDPNNNYQAYVAWPGEEVTAKDAEWYVYNAPKGHNVIFHDNAGMQTNDIEGVQEAACYVPTAIDYSANPKKVTLAEQCTIDYYVAGDEGFTGNNWDPANATCKFDENNQVVFHDVPAGSYQFKITNGTWAWALGGNEFLSDEDGCGNIAYTGDMGNTCFKIDEVQDVTITYYPATRKICLGAVTVKTPGELTANDIELYIDEWRTPNYWTNITDYTAADVELTFVSGDDCIEIANGQMRGKAEGSAVVNIAIAETALFTGVENTFTVTVSAVPPTPDYGSYQRDVTNGNYGTICLPKAGTITGATLFEIADFENNMIYVDEVEGGVMEAGKPYIFQATSDQLNVAYTSNVEVAAGENNGLHGFYNLENENAQFNIPADEGNYILYQNQYWLVSGRPAYINNFRAYIKIGEINHVAPAPGRRRVAMNVNGEQTATGINELNAAEAPVKMIIDGQLYILRGEKLYNVNGQIVK